MKVLIYKKLFNPDAIKYSDRNALYVSSEMVFLSFLQLSAGFAH